MSLLQTYETKVRNKHHRQNQLISTSLNPTRHKRVVLREELIEADCEGTNELIEADYEEKKVKQSEFRTDQAVKSSFLVLRAPRHFGNFFRFLGDFFWILS